MSGVPRVFESPAISLITPNCQVFAVALSLVVTGTTMGMVETN